ncbi:hypothetical protein QLG07_13700 [Erwinia sp. V90_4]|jgi:methyl-accepting chemotaxis protein|uniref:hypothetical protein n=1 Tax=Erwinia sp. V90_4 TaxID=3044239 RepID=UPI00249E66DE|nr:hypothetical protein [Erwinia sp. V90_4]MDI3440518.1 hypothetical protein [Erwinia sp. V90_4]
MGKKTCTLAQRSATAAREIRHLIEINSASVNAGNALVNLSVVTMADIVSSVGQLTDTVNGLIVRFRRFSLQTPYE